MKITFKMPSSSLPLEVCQGELSYRIQISPFSQQAPNLQKAKIHSLNHSQAPSSSQSEGGWGVWVLIWRCIVQLRTSTTALEKSLQADMWKKLAQLTKLLDIHWSLRKSMLLQTSSAGTSTFHLVLAGSSAWCGKSHVRWTLWEDFWWLANAERVEIPLDVPLPLYALA